MPCDYSRYPKNWLKYIRPEILKRAGNHCESCGVRNHAKGYRGESGTFYEVSRSKALKCEKKLIKIVLTIAHVDHDITNNDLMDHQGPALPKHQSNLRAWCQKCHLSHDADHHKHNAAKTRRKKAVDAGQQELDLGI